AFSCTAPPLPGLRNSRMTSKTFGGGVRPESSCAAVRLRAAHRNNAVSRQRVIRFMDETSQVVKLTFGDVRLMRTLRNPNFQSTRSVPERGKQVKKRVSSPI